PAASSAPLAPDPRTGGTPVGRISNPSGSQRTDWESVLRSNDPRERWPRPTKGMEPMTQSPSLGGASAGVVEEVEIQGHIIDSLLLPKVLDEILTRGGSYVLRDIQVGQRQQDPSYARIEVRAPSGAVLEEILASIHDHGAVPVSTQDCQ